MQRGQFSCPKGLHAVNADLALFAGIIIAIMAVLVMISVVISLFQLAKFKSKVGCDSWISHVIRRWFLL